MFTVKYQKQNNLILEIKDIHPPQHFIICETQGSPDHSVGKESTCNAGDSSFIPGLGRSTGEGEGHPLQHSCLENPMDGDAWQATVHGFAKSQT